MRTFFVQQIMEFEGGTTVRIPLGRIFFRLARIFAASYTASSYIEVSAIGG